MPEKTYTIAEIRNYILSQDSLGDVLHFLNERNVEKANEPPELSLEDLEDILDDE
jgi:hypothetical protein